METKGKTEAGGHSIDCMLCGAPLVYYAEAREMECIICHRRFMSNAECEKGHFVCDECHGAEALSILAPFLLSSEEKSPQRLFERVLALPGVHMHGPEHHVIVPSVLLTAYKNCGGDIVLDRALREAARRGKQTVGGACGYLGACGAAVGAGIFASIVLQASPLSPDKWPLPQLLTAKCLEKNAVLGGPRCCKRTSRTAISAAVEFSRERLGVTMPDEPIPCVYTEENSECIKERCPYFNMG